MKRNDSLDNPSDLINDKNKYQINENINYVDNKNNIEEKFIEEEKDLNISGLNENNKPEMEEPILDKNDFITPEYPEKKKFFETRYIKRVAIIIIYMISYILNAIYIRINSLNLIPVKASFIHGAILSIFIPISFFISSNRNFKRNKSYVHKEKEVLNTEIEKNMKEGISDFMNKKFYEVYYHYISKFYLMTSFFSLLYFLSIYFFYQGIDYTQPLFGQLFLPFISIIIIIIKMIDQKIKFSPLKFLSVIFIVTTSFLFIFSFKKNCDVELNSDYAYSTIFLSLFAILQSALIYFLKKTFKTYFYYMDILEFIGYIGIYIVAIVPLILVILYSIFYSELSENNPRGSDFYLVIGKAFFSSCICDLSLAYILKYFSLKIICKLHVINAGIIYLIFCIVTDYKMTDDALCICGLVLTGIIICLLINDIYKKNLKRQFYEVNKQKIKASL